MAADQSARRWPVQDAEARFGELLEASLNEGPQIVTQQGVEAAVLIPFEEWRRLQSSARPTLSVVREEIETYSVGGAMARYRKLPIALQA